MNQKNFVLHTYIHQARKLKKEHPLHFSNCWVYTLPVSKVLLYFTFIFALTVFFCAATIFFSIDFTLPKTYFPLFWNTFHSSLVPTECSWNEPTAPFSTALSCTPPLLFHVLLTDSQASGYTSSLSPAPPSMAGPATMSICKGPTLFLRFSLKTEASTCFPSHSLFCCLCFQLKLSFCFCVNCWSISLLFQAP